jgi:hypothetical protein
MDENIVSMYAVSNRLSDKSVENLALWLAQYQQSAN